MLSFNHSYEGNVVSLIYISQKFLVFTNLMVIPFDFTLYLLHFKVYQNYSFEELRYTSPPVKRSGENMLVRGNCDGTYCATWTPAATGCFSIIVNIDSYELEEVSHLPS